MPAAAVLDCFPCASGRQGVVAVEKFLVVGEGFGDQAEFGKHEGDWSAMRDERDRPGFQTGVTRLFPHRSEAYVDVVTLLFGTPFGQPVLDRKSTRLNSSHT